LITSWGTITGLVTVSQGFSFNGLDWDVATITQTWDSFTSLEEKTLSSAEHYVKNDATVDAEFSLATTCKDVASADCSGDITSTVEYLLDANEIPFGNDGYLTADFKAGREVVTIILPGATTLNDIVTIDFDEYVNSGYPVSVNILLDVNGDGVFDSKKDLETGYLTGGEQDDVLKIEWAYNGGIDAGYLHADAYMNSDNSGYSTWLFGGMGTIDDSTNAWLYSGKPGAIGDTEFNYGTLTDWKNGRQRGLTCYYVDDAWESESCTDVLINSATKVYGIQIESLGFIAESSSVVKNIVIGSTDYEMSGLPKGEQTDFQIVTDFPKMLVPDTYTITTTVGIVA